MAKQKWLCPMCQGAGWCGRPCAMHEDGWREMERRGMPPPVFVGANASLPPKGVFAAWIIRRGGRPKRRGETVTPPKTVTRETVTHDETVTRTQVGEDHVCTVCGEPMPDDARPHARYCSDACRQRAYRGRGEEAGR